MTKVTLTEKERAEFAVSLKLLRKIYHVSLIDVEELTGITNQSISRYENGLSAPSVFQAYKIAKCFGVTVEEMIQGELTLPFPEREKQTESDEEK